VETASQRLATEVTARIWPCVELQYRWLEGLPAVDPKPQLVPRPALATIGPARLRRSAPDEHDRAA
jgi:hypothetical protein